jgi:hypothetical protein
MNALMQYSTLSALQKWTVAISIYAYMRTKTDLPDVTPITEPPGTETAMRKITNNAQFRNAN